MEFTQRSNLSSLIPALLVSLLALAANYYVRMAPCMTAQQRPAVSLGANSPSSGGQQVTHPVAVEGLPESQLAEATGKQKPGVSSKVPPETQLRDIERRLSTVFRRWQTDQTSVSARVLSDLVQQADAAADELLSGERLSASERMALERRRLKIQFMAAELAPAKQSASFLAAADAFIQFHGDKAAGPVAVLQLIHRHHVSPLSDDGLLAKLEEFTWQYPDPYLGTTLYALMADDLYRRGYRELALRVVRQGMELYKGQAAVSRLVNLLVDLQHRKP